MRSTVLLRKQEPRVTRESPVRSAPAFGGS